MNVEINNLNLMIDLWEYGNLTKYHHDIVSVAEKIKVANSSAETKPMKTYYSSPSTSSSPNVQTL